MSHLNNYEVNIVRDNGDQKLRVGVTLQTRKVWPDNEGFDYLLANYVPKSRQEVLLDGATVVAVLDSDGEIIGYKIHTNHSRKQLKGMRTEVPA